FDKSKLPVDASSLTISFSYHFDEKGEEEIDELERNKDDENAATSSSQAAEITEIFNKRTKESNTNASSNNVLGD
ncbi:8710_t:CDS:1, partial [Cetraspora pellucida]